MSEAKSSSDDNPTVTIHGKEVKLVAEPGIDVRKVISAKPFQEWLEKLDKEIHISQIHFQSVDMFGSRVGFIKFKVRH